MYVTAVAGLNMMFAFILMAITTIYPIYPLLMIAVTKSLVPTILKSSVPLVTVASIYGSAYGVYEVAESIGDFVLQPLSGYLKDQTTNYQIDLFLFAAIAFFAFVLSIVISLINWYNDGNLNSRILHSTLLVGHASGVSGSSTDSPDEDGRESGSSAESRRDGDGIPLVGVNENMKSRHTNDVERNNFVEN